MSFKVWPVLLCLPMVLCGHVIAAQSQEVERLLQMVSSDDIKEREKAAIELTTLGLSVRARIHKEILTADSDRAARLRVILDAIDSQPASLVSRIESILSEHAGSLHHSVRGVSHRVRGTCDGKPWMDLERALKAAQIECLGSWEDPGKRSEARHEYLLKRGAFRCAQEITFDLRLNIVTKVQVPVHEKSRTFIESARAVWIAKIDRPFSQVAKDQPFPRGSAPDVMLQHPSLGKKRGDYPMLKEVLLYYSFDKEEASKILDYRWAFNVRPVLLSKDGASECVFDLRAPSDLDLPVKNDGMASDPSWAPRDVLGPMRESLVSWTVPGSGKGGTWTLIGAQSAKRQEEDSRKMIKAYNAPDLRGMSNDIVILVIVYPNLDEGDLASLPSAGDLHTISIESNQLTQAIVRRLRGVGKLRYLGIAVQERLSREAVKELAELPIDSLSLESASQLDDHDLELLCTSKSLTSLELHGSKSDISDQGLRHLRKVPNLKHLGLGAMSSLTPKGLSELADMRSLRSLAVRYMPQLDNSALKSIGGLTQLEEISLYQLSINNEGLSALSELKNLIRLNISACKGITREGLMSLQSKLPQALEFEGK